MRIEKRETIVINKEEVRTWAEFSEFMQELFDKTCDPKIQKLLYEINDGMTYLYDYIDREED